MSGAFRSAAVRIHARPLRKPEPVVWGVRSVRRYHAPGGRVGGLPSWTLLLPRAAVTAGTLVPKPGLRNLLPPHRGITADYRFVTHNVIRDETVDVTESAGTTCMPG